MKKSSVVSFILPAILIVGSARITNADYDVTTASQAFSPTHKLQLKDLPGAVQQTFMQQAAGANIESISKTDRSDRTVYRIQAVQDGVRTVMEITQNGSLLTIANDFSGLATPVYIQGSGGRSAGY